MVFWAQSTTKGYFRAENTSNHLLLIPHKSHETTKFFQMHKISLDTNIKQNIQHQTHIFEPVVDQLYHPCFKKKHMRLGHAGIVDLHLIFRYQIFEKINYKGMDRNKQTKI